MQATSCRKGKRVGGGEKGSERRILVYILGLPCENSWLEVASAKGLLQSQSVVAGTKPVGV